MNRMNTPSDPRTIRRDSTPSTGLAILNVVLALLAVGGGLALIAGLVFGGLLWSSFGGVAYDADDWTVRRARHSADAIARPAVAQVVEDLAPSLGRPAVQAMVDNCNPSPQFFDNRLTCVRSYVVYYPVSGTIPEAAMVAGPISTSRWPAASNGYCLTSSGMTRACRASGPTSLVIQVNGSNSYGRLPDGASRSHLVEEEGLTELEAAVKAGPCIVVAYTTTYFSD